MMEKIKREIGEAVNIISDIFIVVFALTLLYACSGCATKARHIDLAGLYATEAGVLAVGAVEIQSAPEGIEAAMVSYADDTSWFSDEKAHKIKILLTGTNAVHTADKIVADICDAFKATAPALTEAK